MISFSAFWPFPPPFLLFLLSYPFLKNFYFSNIDEILKLLAYSRCRFNVDWEMWHTKMREIERKRQWVWVCIIRWRIGLKRTLSIDFEEIFLTQQIFLRRSLTYSSCYKPCLTPSTFLPINDYHSGVFTL